MKKRKRVKIKNVEALILSVFILISLLVLVAYTIYRYTAGYSKKLSISLNGENIVNIEYGDTYIDKGATASYKGKDISKDIEEKNNLNLDKVGSYKYTYTIRYKQKEKSIIRKVNVVDTKKPELILNGDSEVILYVGESYKEKFARAIDNYDGDISENVEIAGNVDTGKVGEYTIVYTINDSSLNEVSIERKVTVIEKNSKKTSSNSNIVGTTSKGYKIEKKNDIYYINDIIIANKTYSLPSSYNPGDLLDVFKTNFNKLQEAAKKDGIGLSIGSGFRSYSRQQTLYNNYVSRDGKEKADTYSARPGHSEHQTGLAADIKGKNSEDKYLQQSWENTEDGKWLNDNCYKYGFIIRYVKGKEDITGYIFEPWHIRYVGEKLAKELYNNGDWLTLEEYFGITSKY